MNSISEKIHCLKLIVIKTVRIRMLVLITDRIMAKNPFRISNKERRWIIQLNNVVIEVARMRILVQITQTISLSIFLFSFL